MPRKSAAANAESSATPITKVAPVISTQQHAVHTEDTPVAQPDNINLPPIDQSIIAREPEKIIPVDRPLIPEYEAALAFGEDMLEILLEPPNEENPQLFVPVAVNGEQKVIKVGEITKIRRKFIEALMRARPVSIRTQHPGIGQTEDPHIPNQILRSERAKYPLQILHDPSPKGREWIMRIRAER